MKKLLSLLLALCMLFALAACAGGTDEPAATTASGSDATQAPTTNGDTGYTGSAGFDVSKYDGVDFEIMWQESDSTQIEIVNDYAKAAIAEAFPNVNITWVGNVDTNYSTLAQTGELSDVWFGNASLEMIQSGVILDLTPYLTADTYLADNFLNPDFFYFRDHIWAVGTGVDNFYTGTLYINQDIFDELGLNSNFANFDEMYTACQTLLDNGYLPLSIAGGGQNSVFDRFLFQNAIISVDPQAYVDILGGGDLNTEAVTTAMQNIADLRDAGFLGTGTSVKETADSIGEFVNGTAAMIYSDSWNNSSTVAVLDNFDKVTVAWWPTDNAEFATGEYQANWGSPQSGWNANANTEYPELAVEVIKVILKAEAARHLAAGLTTNYFQDGTATPANDLEAQRAEIYASVGTWYKGFMQNTMDETFSTEFCAQSATFLSDDHYPVADYLGALQTAWDSNTYFD